MEYESTTDKPATVNTAHKQQPSVPDDKSTATECCSEEEVGEDEKEEDGTWLVSMHYTHTAADIILLTRWLGLIGASESS